VPAKGIDFFFFCDDKRFGGKGRGRGAENVQQEKSGKEDQGSEGGLLDMTGFFAAIMMAE